MFKCRNSLGNLRWPALALPLAALLALSVPATAADPADYPGSVDNGDGTFTYVFRPGPGANNGSDQGGLNGGKDAVAFEPSPNTLTYWDQPSLGTWNSNCNNWHAWAYLQFDLSTLPDPADTANIRFKFYVKISRGYGWPYQLSTTTFDVYRVTSPWQENTLTWNNRPSDAGIVEGTASVNNTSPTSPFFDGFVEMDITDLYKKWKSDPVAYPNHGLMLKRRELICENANGTYINSSDNAAESTRPALQIVYRSESSPPEPPAECSGPSGGLTVSNVGAIGNQFTPKYNPGDGYLWTMTTAGFDAVGKISLAGAFSVVDGYVGGGGGAGPNTMVVLPSLGTKGKIALYDCNYGGTWFIYDAATGGKSALPTGRTPATGRCDGSIMGVAANADGTRVYHHVGANIYLIDLVAGTSELVATYAPFNNPGAPLYELSWDAATGSLLGHGHDGSRHHLYRINVTTGTVTEIPVSLTSWDYTVPDPATGLIYLSAADRVRRLNPSTGGIETFDLPAGSFSQFSTLGPARTGSGKSLYGLAGANPNRVVEIAGLACGTPPPDDTTPPVITPAVSGTVGANGWYVSNVSLAWTVSDPESPVSSTSGCDPASVSADTGGVTFTCTATSAGGTATESVAVKRDATPPSISGSRTPGPNANGWNNADVTVSFTCLDNLSGVAACPPPQIVQTETAELSVVGIAEDGAGNRSSRSVGPIRIDKTPPTVTYAGNAGAYTIDQTVAITCTAADALSGVASTTCADIGGAAYAFTLGMNTFSASAADRAGNSGSGSTSFTVNVTFASLRNLTRQFVTKPGILNSLEAKLNAAEAAAARGNANAKAGPLGAYVNEVQAQSGKALTAEQAAILVRLAQAL